MQFWITKFPLFIKYTAQSTQDQITDNSCQIRFFNTYSYTKILSQYLNPRSLGSEFFSLTFSTSIQVLHSPLKLQAQLLTCICKYIYCRLISCSFNYFFKGLVDSRLATEIPIIRDDQVDMEGAVIQGKHLIQAFNMVSTT